MTTKDLCGFLRECGTFFLLTADGDRPVGRPFGAVTEIGGDFYLSTSAEKAVYAQMQANANVQIVALKHGTRDWARIDGVAEDCGDRAKKQRMLDDCPDLFRHYRSADDPKFTLVRVRVTRAELHTAAGVSEIGRIR